MHNLRAYVLRTDFQPDDKVALPLRGSAKMEHFNFSLKYILLRDIRLNHTAAILVKTIDFTFLGPLALALKRFRMLQTKAFNVMGINIMAGV